MLQLGTDMNTGEVFGINSLTFTYLNDTVVDGNGNTIQESRIYLVALIDSNGNRVLLSDIPNTSLNGVIKLSTVQMGNYLGLVPAIDSQNVLTSLLVYTGLYPNTESFKMIDLVEDTFVTSDTTVFQSTLRELQTYAVAHCKVLQMISYTDVFTNGAMYGYIFNKTPDVREVYPHYTDYFINGYVSAGYITAENILNPSTNQEPVQSLYQQPSSQVEIPKEEVIYETNAVDTKTNGVDDITTEPSQNPYTELQTNSGTDINIMPEPAEDISEEPAGDMQQESVENTMNNIADEVGVDENINYNTTEDISDISQTSVTEIPVESQEHPQTQEKVTALSWGSQPVIEEPQVEYNGQSEEPNQPLEQIEHTPEEHTQESQVTMLDGSGLLSDDAIANEFADTEYSQQSTVEEETVESPVQNSSDVFDVNTPIDLTPYKALIDLDVCRSFGNKLTIEPVTEIEKYAFGIMSRGLLVTYDENPEFLEQFRSVDKWNNFIQAIDSITDALSLCQDNLDSLRMLGQDASQVFAAIQNIMYRPNTSCRNVNSGVATEETFVIFRTIFNFLKIYGYHFNKYRFLWVLLHYNIGLTSDYKYNGVFFMMHLCRIEQTLDVIYRLIANFQSDTPIEVILEQLKTVTLKDILIKVDSIIMYYYSCIVIGFVEDATDDDDDVASISIAKGCNMAMLEFIRNEFFSSDTTVERIKELNGSNALTISDMISSFVDENGIATPVKLNTGGDIMPFVEAIGMPDLQCFFLETEFRFIYNDELLNNDVVSYVIHKYMERISSFYGADSETILGYWSTLSLKFKANIYGLAVHPKTGNFLMDIAKLPVEQSVLAVLPQQVLYAIYQMRKPYIGFDLPSSMEFMSEEDYAECNDLLLHSDIANMSSTSVSQLIGYIDNLLVTDGYPQEIIKSLMSNAAGLYDTAYCSNADSEFACKAMKKLVSYVYGETEDGTSIVSEIPLELSGCEQEVADYYKEFVLDFSNMSIIRHSLKHDISSALQSELKTFKIDAYNTALRELKNGYPEYRDKLASAEEILVLNRGISYEFYGFVVGQVESYPSQIILQSTAQAEAPVELTIEGFLVKEPGLGKEKLEYIPALGVTSINTILQLGYDLGLADYLRTFKNKISTVSSAQSILTYCRSSVAAKSKVIKKALPDIPSMSDEELLAEITKKVDSLINKCERPFSEQIEGLSIPLAGKKVRMGNVFNQDLGAELIFIASIDGEYDNIETVVVNSDGSKSMAYRQVFVKPHIITISYTSLVNQDTAKVCFSYENQVDANGKKMRIEDLFNLQTKVKAVKKILTTNMTYGVSPTLTITVPKWVYYGNTLDENGNQIIPKEQLEIAAQRFGCEGKEIEEKAIFVTTLAFFYPVLKAARKSLDDFKTKMLTDEDIATRVWKAYHPDKVEQNKK